MKMAALKARVRELEEEVEHYRALTLRSHELLKELRDVALRGVSEVAKRRAAKFAKK